MAPYNTLPVQTRLVEPHNYPGKLIIVEGIDGSGKSTQLRLLQSWLDSLGFPTVFTEWNSSALVKKATKQGKKRNELTPTTFSLLHATDFADRLIYEIIPPLKAGCVVLADRYAYTAFARDIVRGVQPDWERHLYSFAIRPDIAFYFRVPIAVALNRLLSGRAKLKYYEAGMDLNLHTEITESFRLFQGRILDEYDQMSREFDFVVLDATHSIDRQQRYVRQVVRQRLADYFSAHEVVAS